MDSVADSCSDDNVRKPSFNRHVTTACDACRRRRRKCDGDIPCSTCSKTGGVCVYSLDDGRRQRHRKEQNIIDHLSSQRSTVPPGEAVDLVQEGSPSNRIQNATILTKVAATGDGRAQPSIAGRCIRPATMALQADDTIMPDLTSQDSGPQEMTRSRPGWLSRAETAQQTPESTPLSDNSGSSGEYPELQVQAMKSMQGQFEVHGFNVSHKPDAGPHHLPHLPIRPKDASTPQPVPRRKCAQDRAPDQDRARQFVWQLSRRRYAVPGYTRSFGNLPISSSIVANGYPSDIQARQMQNFSIPEYLIFPLVETDESPLGRAYLDFQQLGQRLIREGTASTSIADQGLVDVTLFFRERLDSDPINASTWTSEMLRAFRGTLSDELLLACAVGVASLMRWLLVPTQENYSNMPSIVRPTPVQRQKPHPPWVDVMVFPSFRNALVDKVRDWVGPCTKADWKILWPRSLEDALARNTASSQVFLTQEFTDFVVQPKNWWMGRVILDDFPEIEGSEMNISCN